MERERGIAVLQLGRYLPGQPAYDVVGEMRTVLGACGFQRAVFLRASPRKQLDGSLVIDDSELPLISAQAPGFARF